MLILDGFCASIGAISEVRACLCVSRAVYWPGDYDSRFLLSVFTSQHHVFTVFLLRVTLNCEGFVGLFFATFKNKEVGRLFRC